MKNPRIILAIGVIVMLFGGIFVGKTLGFWQTEGVKIPKKIEIGEFKGEYDPWDIRGSYTFGNVEDSFGIESEILAKAFGVKDDNPYDFPIKNLEAMYENSGFPVEIGTASVRYFVALYRNLPIESNEGITKQAVNILYENDKITNDQYQNLLAEAIDLSGSYEKTESSTEDGITDETVVHESATSVTGSTTVREALDMGIPEDVLKEYIGNTNNKDALVKDLVSSMGLSFGEVKIILNEYIEDN